MQQNDIDCNCFRLASYLFFRHVWTNKIRYDTMLRSNRRDGDAAAMVREVCSDELAEHQGLGGGGGGGGPGVSDRLGLMIKLDRIAALMIDRSSVCRLYQPAMHAT